MDEGLVIVIFDHTKARAGPTEATLWRRRSSCSWSAAATRWATSARRMALRSTSWQGVPGPPLLVQVCVDVQDPQTHDREARALAAAADDLRGASALLIMLELTPPTPGLPAPLEWRCAADWLLGEPAAA